MPVTFVVEGQLVKGVVRVVEGAMDGHRGELRFVRLRDGEWRAMQESGAAVVTRSDRFEYNLDTRELLRPKDAFCELRIELWVDDALHSTADRVVVFRRRVEAHAFDARDAAVAGAVARLTVTLHPDYLESRHKHLAGESRPGGQMVFRQVTNAQGLAAFSDLPCGTWALEWARPHLMLGAGWLADEGFTLDGTRRKAKLSTRDITARLVFPLVGAERKQWVNLDPLQPAVAPDVGAPHPEYGSLLKVKVAVNSPDAGLAGDVVFIKVTFDEGNSARTGAPRPALEGVERPAVTQKAQKALAADGAEVTFDVQLGVAGGDRVTIAVGGTPECNDGTVTVVTWRRVVVKTVYPTGFPTPPAIAAAVRDRTIAIYRSVFVELVFDPTALASADGPAFANVRAPALAAVAASMKFTPTVDNLVYQSTNPEKSFYANNNAYPAYPPTLYLVPARAALGSANKDETFVFDGRPRRVDGAQGSTTDSRVGGRSRSGIASARGNYFLPQALDGTSNVQPYQGRPSHWVDSTDTEQPVTDAYLEVASDHKSFEFKIPSGVPHRPGLMGKTVVRLVVKTYESNAGSSSGRWIWFKNGGDEGFSTYALAHEIGHSVGQVAVLPSASGLSAQKDNPYQYEYSGAHCSYGVRGLTDEDRVDEVRTVTKIQTTMVLLPGSKDYRQQRTEVQAQESVPWGGRQDWADIAKKGKHGPCLMFSPAGAKHTFTTVDFCPVCKAFLKAADVNAKLR